jgi:hypothetical protein
MIYSSACGKRLAFDRRLRAEVVVYKITALYVCVLKYGNFFAADLVPANYVIDTRF